MSWGGLTLAVGLLALAATIGGWPGWGIVALLAWMLSRG
jgi:hypothetical protein